jgi:hypothetical protein
MLSAVILAGIGWLGLALVLLGTRPTVGPRWLFFFLWTVAVTGTAMPFIWVLNRRFSRLHLPTLAVLLRESLLVGLYAGLCAWLQINRSLNLPLALLLASGLIAIEWLLRGVDRGSLGPEL